MSMFVRVERYRSKVGFTLSFRYFLEVLISSKIAWHSDTAVIIREGPVKRYLAWNKQTIVGGKWLQYWCSFALMSVCVNCKLKLKNILFDEAFSYITVDSKQHADTVLLTSPWHQKGCFFRLNKASPQLEKTVKSCFQDLWYLAWINPISDCETLLQVPSKTHFLCCAMTVDNY